MKFARWIVALMGVMAVSGPTFASGQDLGDSATRRSPQDVLAVVPGESWAVLCVPSLSRLDQKLNTFSQQLQLPMMGPPLGMAKMMLGVMGGFDDAGGLALALLPIHDVTEVGKSIVVFVPITSFDDLVAPMSPQPAEKGMTKLYFLEQETYAAPFGKFAVMAQNPESLTRVLKAKKSFRDLLSEDRIARVEEDDITLWGNLKAFTSTELFATYATMLEQLNVDPKDIRQINTAALSIRFDEAGLNFGAHFDADTASDLGRVLAATRSTDESTLIGLPDEPYLVATGSFVSEAAAKRASNLMSKALGLVTRQAGEQKELLEGLWKTVSELVGNVRRSAVSVVVLPEGSDGLVGITAVITTDGAGKRVLAAVRKSVASLKDAFAGDAQVAPYTGLVTHTSAAETVAGLAVDHLKIKLPFEPGSEEKTRADKILGSEGLLFRFVGIDDNRVAVAFGGGTARLNKVIEAVKSGSAPLARDRGIQWVAPHLPKSRSSELYIAVDRVLKLIAAIGEAVDDPLPLPADLPDVNAPVAVVTAPRPPAGAQSELFIPIPLLKAAKDVAMSQLLAPPPPQQRQAPPGVQPGDRLGPTGAD